MTQLSQLFFLCLSLAAGFAAAQTTPAPAAPNAAAAFPTDATLAEIRFEGISDPIVESLVRVQLVSRPGIPVADIDLSAERNRVNNVGTFEQVSLSVEARPVGPVLFVRVTENPPIREVVLRGFKVLDADAQRQIRTILEQQNLVAAGQIYNSTRAEEAVTTLQTIYRQVGFPGAIPVTLEVRPVTPNARADSQSEPENAPEELTNPAAEAAGRAETQLGDAQAVRLIYTVNEAPPIDSVTFTGATVLNNDELNGIFRAVENLDTFDLQTYLRATQEVSRVYDERGFQGSGVNAGESTLAGGTLQVDITELTILSLNTTAIGIDPARFSLQPGDLYNYNTLLADVQRLAQGRSEDIRLEPQEPIGGAVQIVFSEGPPASAGPITRIAIEGNTVFTDAELKLQLQLRAGQTFTSALAAEDFTRLQSFYTDAGYLLVPNADFNFRDGTYVQRLREVKIAGYRVNLQTQDPQTKPRVITRYLPPVGSVYNQNEMNQGMIEINQLQVVTLAQLGPAIAHRLLPTQNPAQQLVEVIAQDQPSTTLSPSAELSTEGGVSFGADVAVSDSNLFGEAHNASASLSATTSDIGFLAGGNIRYTIPWLDIDFLDFREVPTTISGELLSEVTSNQPLSNGGNRRICLDDAEADPNTCLNNDAIIGEYTQRDTGFRFSVGRPIIPNLSANISTQFTQSDYYAEPAREVCKPEALTDTCALPLAQAQQYVPQSGFSSFLGSNFAYDTRNNPQAPSSGYRFTVGGGVGFGNDYRNAAGVQQGYTYEQLEVGARTYLTPFANKNHVFAFRIDAGHQFGAEYPDSRLFVIGDTNNQATQIRGYRREDINSSRTYATGTAEYRYDFGLSTAVTQTVVGIGFLDLGYASSVPGFEQPPLLGSVGVGVQLNIGFGGGLALPPLRFDYGISPTNPTGVFGFRLGFNF